jgi:hypothetical protein
MLLHARQARKDLRPDSQAFYSRDGGMDIDVEYVVPLKKNSKIFSMLSADKMLTTGTAVDSGQYSAIILMPSGYFHAARRPSAASASAADREDRNLIQAIADRTADAVRAPCGARLLDLASAARRVRPAAPGQGLRHQRGHRDPLRDQRRAADRMGASASTPDTVNVDRAGTAGP